MKKILSPFFALVIFVGFLLLPVFVSVYTSMMSTHHSDSNFPCLEHCLSSMEYDESLTLGNILGANLEIGVKKIFFSELILYVIPLASLYVFIYYSPPSLFRKIKNYSYGDLRGIVIATT